MKATLIKEAAQQISQIVERLGPTDDVVKSMQPTWPYSRTLVMSICKKKDIECSRELLNKRFEEFTAKTDEEFHDLMTECISVINVTAKDISEDSEKPFTKIRNDVVEGVLLEMYGEIPWFKKSKSKAKLDKEAKQIQDEAAVEPLREGFIENEDTDFSALDLPELRKTAKAFGVKGFSKMKKQVLVDAVTAAVAEARAQAATEAEAEEDDAELGEDDAYVGESEHDTVEDDVEEDDVEEDDVEEDDVEEDDVEEEI